MFHRGGVEDTSAVSPAPTATAKLFKASSVETVVKENASPRLDAALCCTGATMFDGDTERAAPTVSMLSGHKLSRAVEYIDANLGRHLKLPEIAQTLGMSPHHFAHAFKQTMGVAPHQYLIARRVARAKSLLRETDLPMGEIAYRVGYSNQAHFSTLFHRFAAMTPTTFRQQG
jgi:AraC-like DNA-binding protein